MLSSMITASVQFKKFLSNNRSVMSILHLQRKKAVFSVLQHVRVVSVFLTLEVSPNQQYALRIYMRSQQGNLP
jgi:hypothetical protein